LVQRRLIARKEDPAKKRVLRMKLTAPGRKLPKNCDDIADRIEEAASDWIDPNDYQTLRQGLCLLLQGLRERKSTLLIQNDSKRRVSS
jgi:DNA-binding MarR family transcriptional regulator